MSSQILKSDPGLGERQVRGEEDRITPGETVVDLGSGGGFDCFLAAKAVGEAGQVIGVDMTPEMIHKARQHAETMGTRNVESRPGEIEPLPVADQSLAISDVLATAPLPEHVQQNLALVAACVGSAATIAETEETPDTIGFQAITITPNEQNRGLCRFRIH